MCFLRENKEVFYLAEQLQKYGADIGKIIYMPTLDPHHPSDALFDLLHRIEPSNLDALENQFSGFKESYLNFKSIDYKEKNEFACDFIMELHRHSDAAFIVQIKLCRKIEQVHINSKGDVTGFDGNWNSYSSIWVFAKNMEHAMQQGIKFGHENLLKINKKDFV